MCAVSLCILLSATSKPIKRLIRSYPLAYKNIYCKEEKARTINTFYVLYTTCLENYKYLLQSARPPSDLYCYNYYFQSSSMSMYLCLTSWPCHSFDKATQCLKRVNYSDAVLVFTKVVHTSVEESVYVGTNFALYTLQVKGIHVIPSVTIAIRPWDLCTVLDLVLTLGSIK